MEPNEISYAELKDLVEEVRLQAFKEFKIFDDSWELIVYQKFLQAYSLGKYEDLFVIWKGGLQQMQGRNLISVVKELVG